MKSFFREADVVLIALALALSLVGVFLIASAVHTWPNHGLEYIGVQLASIFLGLVSIWLIYVLGYENLADFWKWLYAIMILLLLSTLFLGSGLAETGTRRWLILGPIRFQPSEIAKVIFIVTLAKHLELIKEDINYIKNAALLFIHMAIPVILVALQPDAGTALAFVFIFFVLVFISGIDWRYLASAAVAAIAAAPPVYFFFLQDYQRARIISFLNPGQSPAGADWQVMQSQLAIGSGNIFGSGPFQGLQTQAGLIPAGHTDFIFAVLGEEFGFFGSLIVLALFFGMAWRCIHLAKNKGKDKRLGRLICIGFAAYLTYHGMVNILMTLGLAPVTGIPLPLVSYGGTSILACMIGVGFAATGGKT